MFCSVDSPQVPSRVPCPGCPSGSSLSMLAFLTALLFLFSVGLTLGQSSLLPPLVSSPREDDYLIKKWETDDGLPENSANAMVQTEDGYIWFATFGGLVRFDGIEFKVYDRSNTPELPGAGIVNLHLEPSGRMWVSTVTGLVTREGYRWTSYSATNGWTGNYVRTFSQGGGVLCLTSFDGKVFRAQNGVLQELPEPPGDKSGYFGHVESNGQIWLAQNGFFGFWDGQKWQASEHQAVVTNNFKVAGNGQDGSLMVFSNQKLLRFDRGTLISTVDFSEQLRDCWCLHDDHEGNAWIGTLREGLFSVSPSGGTRHYTAENGLAYPSLRFVFEDRERNIWAGGSGGGLIRLKKRAFFNYGVKEGLIEQVVKAVAEEAPGSILVGTYGRGLFRVRDGKVSPFVSERDAAFRFNSQCVLVDRQHRIWLGTFESGLHVFTGSAHQFIPPKESGGSNITALFEDSKGRIWVGGNTEVRVFEVGKTEQGQSNGSPAIPEVQSFAEDTADGTLWAANFKGLFHLVDGVWKEVQGHDGNGVKGVLCLRAEKGGVLWVGGAGVGLLRLKDGLWSTLSEQQGLPSRNIRGITDDGLGFWWLASNQGIIRVATRDVELAISGLSSIISCQAFDRSDGLASVECALGFQTTGIKDSHGRLWFSTLKGAAVVDPRVLPFNTNPPPVFIQQFSFKDSEGLDHTHGPQPVKVTPGSREMRVAFAGLSYTAPEKMKFAYRIDGINRDWVSIEGRSLQMVPPPPGNYVLRVKASNNDGVWNETGASLAFSVQPYLWQTVWFRALALAGLLGATSAGVWRAGRAKLHLQIERLQNKALLEKERARLASVLEATTDFVGFTDPDGKTLFLNRAGRRMVGLGETEDISDTRLSDFQPPYTVDILSREGVPAALKNGHWSGETALRDRSGREIAVLQVIVAHRRANGVLDFMSTVARDISERKIAENALREKEDRLRALGDNLPNGMVYQIIREPDGTMRFLYVSAGVERLYGLLAEDVLQSSGLLYQQIVEEDREAVREAEERSYQSMGIFSVVVRSLRSDGQMRWVHLCSAPRRLDDGRVVWDGIAADITDRKAAELQKEQMEAQLRQAQKLESLGTLAGGIAHDFNNILGAIIVSAELAKMENEGNAGLREALEQILSSSQRAASLVRQILSFSRQRQPELKSTQLAPVLGEVLQLLRSTLPTTIEIRTDIEANLPDVLVDSTQLHQVIMNLCANAAYAMKGRQGCLSVSLRAITLPADSAKPHNQLKTGDYVLLQIADNGSGIEASVLKRIFEPFFTTKPPGEGTGLGLAVVHGIIQDHEGVILVKSEPGCGSTFSIYLPSVHPQPQVKTGDPASLSAGKGERILFVDDEPALGSLAVRTMTRLGFVPSAFTSPEQAWLAVQKEPHAFSVIITDLTMPGMTGIDLARKIRSILPVVPIILATGYSGSLARETLDELNIFDLVQKPMDFRALALVVSRALRKS